jgi:hypothetical protein
MDATRGIRAIIDGAKSRGFRVEESATRCMISTGKTNRAVGIIICEDGSAYRSDVELSLCLAIRSQREMRSILGLSQVSTGNPNDVSLATATTCDTNRKNHLTKNR